MLLKLFAIAFLCLALFLLYHAYVLNPAEVYTHSQFMHSIDVESARGVIVCVAIICLVAAIVCFYDSRV